MKISKNAVISIFSIIGIFVLISAVLFFVKSEKLTDKNSVKVYFVKTDSGQNPNNELKSKQSVNYVVLPVKRKILPDESRISTAITELLKGPSEKEAKAGFYTEIPKTSKLLNIKESNQKIILNISKDFESGGGSVSMSVRLKQLVNTALDSSEGKLVYLELDGKKVDFIGGEGVIVSQPLSR